MRERLGIPRAQAKPFAVAAGALFRLVRFAVVGCSLTQHGLHV